MKVVTSLAISPSPRTEGPPITLPTITPPRWPHQSARLDTFQQSHHDRTAQTYAPPTPTFKPSIYFGIRFTATQVSPFQSDLEQWAEAEGHDKRRLPTLVEHPKSRRSLSYATYATATHTLNIYPSLLERVNINRHYMLGHEGTHAVLASLRTQWQLEDPTDYKTTCQQWLIQDTLNGEKRPLLFSLKEGEPPRFIDRPYVPEPSSRQAIADFLLDTINHQHYDIRRGQAQLKDQQLPRVEALWQDIPDFEMVYCDPEASRRKASTQRDIAVQHLMFYLKSQLLRYHLLTHDSTIPKEHFNRALLDTPLSTAQKRQARASLTEYVPMREANLLIKAPASTHWTPFYPTVQYLFGNWEEWQAHRRGFDHWRHHTTDRALRSQLLHTEALMKTGRTMALQMAQLNQQPRVIATERQRVQAAHTLQHQQHGLAAPLQDHAEAPYRSWPATLKRQLSRFQTLARQHYQWNDPEHLIQPTPARTDALTRIEQLHQQLKSDYARSALPMAVAYFCNGPNDQPLLDRQAIIEVHEHHRQHLPSASTLMDHTLAQAFGPENHFHYKAGL